MIYLRQKTKAKQKQYSKKKKNLLLIFLKMEMKIDENNCLNLIVTSNFKAAHLMEWLSSYDLELATQVQILDEADVFYFTLMSLEKAWIHLFYLSAIGKS